MAMAMVMSMSNKMNFFSFLKKPINPITVDIHSHLLPGIDDGVKTIEESIAIIKKMKLLGYSKLITTPHIMLDMYPNTKEIIQEKLHDVRVAIEKHNIDIVIEASAEYYLDDGFYTLIEDGELIPFMEKYILFETGRASAPNMLDSTIRAIEDRGYTPVLAHPERYSYLHQDINLYKKLKAKGVLFQVNLKSLYQPSNPVSKIALKLIQEGLVDFIGSDVHRMHDVKKIEKVMGSRNYKKLLKKNKLLNNI
jgi:tyrosine-protein phosphatase YwqE